MGLILVYSMIFSIQLFCMALHDNLTPSVTLLYASSFVELCCLYFQMEGDGNCLLRAVLSCCDMEDQVEGKKYGFHQLKLHAVDHIVLHRDVLFD